ncbi:hypothetical protein [Myroides odoratus]|uniref:hypothetical protein n=1 Tax=Myroides odoratus TaxID=256 RepID=UPI00333F52D1
MSNKEEPVIQYKNWIESVAEKTKYDKRVIQSFVQRYNIPQSPSIGTPRRIQIQKVSFSGTKKGRFENDFIFEFENLTSGLWGLFSDGNGKGKSTALEIIKWLLKGKTSEGLQSGVKSWIKKAELVLKSGKTFYSINIRQNEDEFSGELRKSDDGVDFNLYKEFSSEEEMSFVISEFMMSQLDLEKISSNRQGKNDLDSGMEVTHGWSALASAMFIGTSYGAIFGDLVIAGLPNRILNMYMGLPWIPTFAALKSLDGQLKNVAAVENKHKDRAEQDRQKRLIQIQSELKNKKKLIDDLTIPSATMEEYQRLMTEYNLFYALEKDVQREVLDCRSQVKEIKDIVNIDTIKLRNFKEDRAANKIFKQLNPTCCPHCEQKVTQAEIEKELNEHRCSICDKEMLDSEDANEIYEEMNKALKLSSDALEIAKKQSNIKEGKAKELRQKLSDQKDALDCYKRQLDSEEKERISIEILEKEIMKLEILESEYLNLNDIQDQDSDNLINNGEDELKQVDESLILKEALKETESRFKRMQEELLRDVNKKILEYCPKVGLKQYKNIKLNGQPSLKIEKDGGGTSFSRVSKGEQLRLKVIATIALISVAEERKVGRHPGFLIIDSPAAQEVNKEDLNNLIKGLESLCDELPHLQIVIASVANETLLEYIPEKRRKYAKGDEFLW